MSISAIIITHNEAKMLPGCLKSIEKLANEIVIVDSESSDQTVNIAQAHQAKIIIIPLNTDYASARNSGLAAASGEWILYIDADERITSKLKKEIFEITNYLTAQQAHSPTASRYSSFKIPRQNIMLGAWIKHGGFWPDPVHRLFKKTALIKWSGKVHESPVVKGEVGLLNYPLKHYTARSINSALQKSYRWSSIEAQLLYEASTTRVAWWKLIKAFIQKFIEIFICKQGIRDGIRGLILAYIQAFHQMSVLVSLWQLQQKA